MKFPFWKMLIIAFLAFLLLAIVNRGVAISATEQVPVVCKQVKFNDCKLIKAIIKVESNFNNKAITFDNRPNYGLMQIQCPTAKSVGFKGHCDELFNAETNIKYGVKYIEWLRENLVVDSYPAILSAYNAGLDRYNKLCDKNRCKYYPRYCYSFNNNYVTKARKRECFPGEFINENYVTKVLSVYSSIN
jgi:hypothetical protein